MTDAPWDNTPHDQALDAFYDRVTKPLPPTLAPYLVVSLPFTLEELKLCGDIWDERCKRIEKSLTLDHTHGGYSPDHYAKANALRTFFREAQYGLERQAQG